ncbi:MAG: hypothetical protein NT166_14080 [Candidatus Aminicenantes bacterium]|nr:hypothetical protein [Candidatus Aminicenantes bacterium]
MMKKRQKTFVKIRVIRGLTFVWDFEPLYFEFVSDFGFRISDLFFPLCGPSHYKGVACSAGAFAAISMGWLTAPLKAHIIVI